MPKKIVFVVLLGLFVLALVVPKVLPLLKSGGAAPSSQAAQTAALGSSGGASASSAHRGSTAPAKLPKPSVTAVVVEPTVLTNTITASGTILPGDEVELHTEVAGVITQLNLAEGKNVAKGQMLLKLNDADLQAQLRKAQSRKKLAETQEVRQKQLLAIKSISQNEYDIALNELNSIKAEIDLIQAQIRRTEIHAPFDGTIGLKYVSFGAYVTPTTRIASLVNINTLKIDFSIPGQYASLVHMGDTIGFTLQGVAGEESSARFWAKIYAIEPKIDASTRTLQLRAVFDNKARKVLPGAFAEIELKLGAVPNALVIPTEAMIPELKGQRVFIVHNGTARAVPVETGIRTERLLQITRGLNVGDTVITTGLLQIRDGSPITVTVVKDNAP
jgi:membrane fusion protein (multidrug efflux system)